MYMNATAKCTALLCFMSTPSHLFQYNYKSLQIQRNSEPEEGGKRLQNFKKERMLSKAALFLFFTVLFTSSAAACSNGSCQLLDSCSAASDCASGLYCGTCVAAGKDQPTCFRGQAIQPHSIVNGLPFNKYTWLMTHNSFSIVGAPSLTGAARVTYYNQEDSVTNQLRNGVRGLMLDMYDFEDDIWLCHSFLGQCYNITAFEPAINALKEVETFLAENPSEIVTIIIEDYVRSPKGLTKLFTNAGLLKYWYPVSKMPTEGGDWPTVTDMVAKHYRLLVFTSDASKEADEGIAYQWNYLLENEPGDGGMKQGSCSNRKESHSLNYKHSALFLQNYFPRFPGELQNVCQEHSSGLSKMVDTCYEAAGKKMPNFLAVNFYMRSDGGGVFDAIDKMNGQTLCGCNTILACQAGAPAGLCKRVIADNGTTSTLKGAFNGSVQLLPSAASSGLHFHLASFLVCSFAMFMISLILY